MPRLPSLPGLANIPRRLLSTTTPRMSTTPMEDLMREKLTKEFTPTTLQIRNDSHLHAHHAPMQGVTSKETHFHVTITSSAFQSKMQPARHRMVYALLKDEMARDGGIHALQLRTKTPEEEARERERQA
ncbi:bola-like protein-domain-containing protein [Aspergillus venezuelensis]